MSSKKKRRKNRLYDVEDKDLSFCSQMKILNDFNARMCMEDELICKGEIIPHPMFFDPKRDSAFFLGKSPFGDYVGKRDDVDGHVAAFGRSGSGKTTNFARTTFKTWQGPIFAFDLKGDLISQVKNRKSKILYLMPEHQNQYYIDPFEFIRCDNKRNLIRNCRSLAFAIIPLSPDEKDPFWTISARNILTGALVYFFRLNVSFIQAMIVIKTRKISKLLEKISSDTIAVTCIDRELKKTEKTLNNINSVLQNYIIPFATDVVIQEALSSDSDNPKERINWEDLDNQDILIRIDLSELEQFSGVIRLLLTQLITTLKKRPEKYKPAGKNLKPTLLLFDEFPQYGKIEQITSALKVLRSKDVTFALFCQSLADLDETYGEKIRRTILDNCAYKAILSADDPETQKYWSDLVGTTKTRSDRFSSNFDETGEPSGYSFSISATREPIIYPHEFASLSDIVLLHPGKERFCRLEKELNYQTELETDECDKSTFKNKVLNLKSLEDRIAESKKTVKDAEKRRKLEKHNKN